VVMAMIRVARSELLSKLGWHMVLQVRRRTPACRCGGALGCVVLRAHERAWERESLPAAAGPGPHQSRAGRADVRATGQVHDELILEGPAESAEEAFGEVVACMERPLERPLLVALPVDGKIVDSWYDAK